MSGSVTVLCPNGRRVTVKITPNTSILQIIEEACRKHNYDPDNYGLKHLRRNLDVSSTVRYSNLPNNCQLELIAVSVPRCSGTVTVSIVTEHGQRHINDFPAETSLWEVLAFFANPENGHGLSVPSHDSGQEPLVVYAMRRISGDELHCVTLKGLGLTSGKCMFRYSTQTISTQKPQQPHVAKSLVQPRVVPSFETAEDQNNSSGGNIFSLASLQGQQPDPSPGTSSGFHELPMASAQVPQQVSSPNVIQDEGPDVVSSTQGPLVPDVVQCQSFVNHPDIVAGPSQTEEGSHSLPPVPVVTAGIPQGAALDLVVVHQTEKMATESSSSSTQVSCGDEAAALDPLSSAVSSDAFMENETSQEMKENLIPLGSHDALLFSMDDAPPTDVSDVDDTFFELTEKEVQKLYQEQQQLIKELNESPFITRGMKEMEKQAKILSTLNQFPVTQLRICFPDRHIIQASFKPMDTIKSVMEFLRPFLSDPDTEFYLYMNFPRKVLTPNMNLIEADCIPRALLYFGTHRPCQTYLSEATLQKKSSFCGAASAVIKGRFHKSGGESLTRASFEEKQRTSVAAPNSQDSRGGKGFDSKNIKWLKLGK